MSGKKLLIVIPCYNEEEALPSTLKRMETLMNKMLGEKLIDKNSRVMFVDDGSADNTWQILKKGVGKTPFFEALRLSRNFGHQSAILAGMFDNEADIYVPICRTIPTASLKCSKKSKPAPTSFTASAGNALPTLGSNG